MAPLSFIQQLTAFLQAERQTESGGNYSAYNSGGGASGAYQYIQSTWSAEATDAGYAAYANAPAGDAPPSVQDAVAAYDATQKYATYQNWNNVAEAWYYPAWAGVPQYQNSVPYPSAGNTVTIGAYGAEVVNTMNKILQSGGAQPINTSSGSSQVGAAQLTSANTSTPSLGGGGFLHSFNQILNPGTSLDPFTDVSHSIDMILVRGSLALVGLAMVLAGFAVIVVGTIDIGSLLSNSGKVKAAAEVAAA